jgi:SnoaL-like protein
VALMLGAMRRLLSAAFAVVLATSAGCAHSKIPQTNIDDTPDNREIWKLLEAYQRAIESRDADALIALVSPRYYEDNGNTDRADDFDYDGLRTALPKEFSRTKAMQLEFRVDDIKVDDDKAYAEIYYTYRAQNEFPSGLQWDTGADRTRLRFEKTNGKWLLVGGM